MRHLACLLCLAAAPAEAQSARAQAILAAAEAACAEIDAGGLTVEPGTVTRADLDGDGREDDEVVDFAGLYCDWDMSHWHGTGGAPIHFVIDGTRSQSWWAQTWSTVTLDGRKVILLSRHGSLCGSYGTAPCIQAIVVTPDGFLAVEDGRPDGVVRRDLTK